MHGAPDRQPRRPQAEGRGDRRAAGAAARAAGLPAAPDMRLERLDVAPWPARRRAACRGALRALVPRARRCASAVARDHRGGRARGRRGGAALHARASTPPAPSRRCCVGAAGARRRRSRRSPLDVRAGLEVAIANVAEVAEAGVARGRATSRCPRATASRCARCRCARAAVYVPGRAGALPEHRRDGRRHRPRGGRRRRRRRARRPAGRRIDACDPRRVRAVRRRSASTAWAARRRSPRSPTAPRRSRRVDVIVGPGNLYVQEAKRQLVGRSSASTASPGPATCSSLLDAHDAGAICAWRRSTCSPRPSTARAASSSRVAPDAAAARRARGRAASSSSSSARRSATAACVLVEAATPREATRVRQRLRARAPAS